MKRQPHLMRPLFAMMLLSVFTGCALQARKTDTLMGINAALLTSPTVTLDVYSVNGAFPPQESWDAALARFRKYISGELVIDGPTQITAVGKQGHVGDFTVACKPRPDWITIVVMPEAIGIRRGLYLKRADGVQMITYNKEGIEKYAWLVPRKTLWEIVLLHELGHAIGVPADLAHADRSGHCMNNCVMYWGPDIRSAWRLMLHGWRRDFCPACKAEIDRAKASAKASPEKLPGS